MESNPICQPSSAKKNEMLLFGLRSTSDDQLGLSMGLNPIHHLSPAKKMKCSYFDYVHFRWLVGLINGLEPHLPPFSSQKNEMLIFVLCSTSDVAQTGQWTQTPSTTPLQPIKWNASFWIMFTTDDQPGWSMDSNPICHPSPAKKMKCPYFDYVQLLMTGRAGQWTRKKMKCSFLDYVHFWWSAWLIDELEPHLPPLSYKKNEMINFRLRSTSDVWPDWSMDSNPILHPSPPNKMKCSFLDYVQLLMISQAGQWNRTPSASPLQPKKIKCYFLDYVQLLMISWDCQWTWTPSTSCLQPKKWNPHFCITTSDVGQAGQWTQTPSTTLLHPIKWTAHFWITSTSDDSPGWSMDSNPIPPSSAKKNEISFWIILNFWWSAGLVNGLKSHPPPVSTQRNEMLIFGLRSTSDDQLGLSMDLNPIHHLSPGKKIKCSFLYYIQLLMLARLVNGLKPHPPPLSSQ